MRKRTRDELTGWTLEELRLLPRHPIYAAACHVRSLYNVGALFRTSDAARIERLYLLGGTGHPGVKGKQIEKTALGATESVPWEYHLDPLPPLQGLRERGIQLVALEQTDLSQPYTSLTLSDFPLCLLVGHEVEGIPDGVLAVCDRAIEIPQYGLKQSLNVAVAYGIVVMELVRIWREAHPEAGP